MSNDKKKQKSAQERKKEIVDIFEDFCDERKVCGDWETYIATRGDRLNQKKIAEKLKFARSAWTSNGELKETLLKKEEGLRADGILSASKEKITKSIKAESDRKNRSLDQRNARVKSLEQQLAAMTAERDDLQRRVDRLEFLEHHMTTTGRVPH